MSNKRTNHYSLLHATTRLLVVTMVVMVVVVSMRKAMATKSQFTAMFVFGDSLTDAGNNNYLETFAKANFVPYGVDFIEGTSGRFCNGKIIIDFLGDLLQFPLIPPYMSSSATFGNIYKGVNYASAAGGILEETGTNLGVRFSLSKQVQNFENTLEQLGNMMEEEDLRKYLANSLVMMTLGSNDYINNYLQPIFYTSSTVYTPNAFADLLIQRYTTQILALHGYGLRKFMLGGIGPLGCIPNQLATGQAQPGKCVVSVNNMVEMFNMRLKSLVEKLNKENPGSVFSYGNTFAIFNDILQNATSYGLEVADKGCCGIGRNQGQVTCLPFSTPCMNRDQYVFWDAYHPTQAVNQILARVAYSGPRSICYPVNVQQMEQM